MTLLLASTVKEEWYQGFRQAEEGEDDLPLTRREIDDDGWG